MPEDRQPPPIMGLLLIYTFVTIFLWLLFLFGPQVLQWTLATLVGWMV